MSNLPASIYIHIPFCLSKCGYCSFYSIKSNKLIPQYLKALEKEIEFYSDLFSSFDTIYIGGGTPSLLTPKQIDFILQVVKNKFRMAKGTEITMEANAGDISQSYLKEVHALGINRLNIGIQSFDDRILKFLGRRHSAKEAFGALTDARKAGFKNLGIDLIYGVHGQTGKLWEDTIKKALEYLPEHLSCYQLSLDAETPLGKEYRQAGWKLPDEKAALKYFNAGADLLEAEGYVHYEVSNFARQEEYYSRHNSRYWRHEPYLGVGAAAHSYLANQRWWNKCSVAGYIKDIAEGKKPVAANEQLTDEQLRLEALFLGLRTKRGVDLKDYKRRYGVDLIKDNESFFEELIKNKLVIMQNGFLRPTRAGMAVADSLALI